MHAPPERVLDVLADGWSYTGWVVGTAHIRAVDEHWPQPGSRIAHSVGGWPAQLEDSTVSRQWDPASGRIRLRARGWPLGEAEVDVIVAPHPDGSMVTMREEAVRGPGRFVPRPVRRLVLGARNRESLERLAARAERRSTDPGRARG